MEDNSLKGRRRFAEYDDDPMSEEDRAEFRWIVENELDENGHSIWPTQAPEPDDAVAAPLVLETGTSGWFADEAPQLRLSESALGAGLKVSDVVRGLCAMGLVCLEAEAQRPVAASLGSPNDLPQT